MSELLPLVWAAVSIPLVGAMIRSFARWAAGRTRWWLAVGVLAGAAGVDGLVCLEARLRYLPLPPLVRSVVWPGITGALLWTAWGEWRGLGRVSPAPPAREPGAAAE